MKRKRIFSTLLLGAFVVASTSMFTSCKDYDDDINNVNSRIDNLTTSLNTQITTLQNDLKTAQQTASDAAAAAATAQKSANNAADSAAAAKILAQQAKAAAATAQATADQNAIDLAEAIKEIAKKADQTALDDSVNKLNGMIAAIDTRLLVLEDSATVFSNKIAANHAAIADLQGQVNTLNNFKTLVTETYIPAFQTMYTNLNNKVDSVIGVINGIKEDVAANTQDISTLKTQMQSANDAISKLDTDLNKKISDLGGRVSSLETTVNTLNVYVDKTITSLVFAPNEFVSSFGAIPVYSFSNLYGINVTSSTTPTVDGESYTTDEDAFTYTPEAVANYHLNPTTADISKYDFNFVDLETTNTWNTTRGHQDKEGVSPVINKTAVNSGILSVYFDFNSENVNDAAINMETGKQWISTLALQATRKNLENESSTVTSDYAVLSPTFVQSLDLGNNEYEQDEANTRSVQNYLVDKTSKVALASYHNDEDSVSFKLAYNSEDGINLNNKIEVVYYVNGLQKKMSVEEAAKLGLNVSYTLVPYKMTKSSTVEETAASKVAINDGVATVANSDKSAIGHAALVRVEVKENSKTVVIGYVTILVTPAGLYQIDETYADGLDITCGGSEAHTVLVSGIKQDVMTSTTCTSDQYDEYYNFETGKRYTETDDTKIDEAPFGTVALNNAQDTLTWKFTEAQLKAKFYDKYGNFIAPTKDIVTYVRYISNNTNKYPNVWVKLIIPKDEITRATGSFDLTTAGIKQYWYADGSTTAGSGYKEVHANVPQPGNAGAINDKAFKLNLLSTFNGNEINVALTGADVYKNYDKGANIYFDVAKYDAEKTIKTWAGASGKKYVLTATEKAVTATNADNAAETAVVVKLIDEATVELQYNDIAKDLLNVVSHKNADGTTTSAFMTYMIVKADNNCFPIDLSSSETTFNVRYLRPIDVTASDDVKFVDADQKGYSIVNIAELFKFNDWRDLSFGEENYSWVGFYGISALTPHIDEATCNLNGDDKWEKLSEVSSLIKLTKVTNTQWPAWTWAAFVNNMGAIKYQNLNATVGNFTIKIPFTVVHNWGNIENVIVTINVDNTISNAK